MILTQPGEMSVNRNTSDPTLTCSTPHHTYLTQPNTPLPHSEQPARRLLEHLQGALTMTKKLFTLTGKNAVDDHIPVLAANLYKTTTGQQNPTPTHQDSPISEALRSLTEEVKRIAAKEQPPSKPRPECKHPQPRRRPRQVLC